MSRVHGFGFPKLKRQVLECSPAATVHFCWRDERYLCKSSHGEDTCSYPEAMPLPRSLVALEKAKIMAFRVQPASKTNLAGKPGLNKHPRVNFLDDLRRERVLK